ncbi:hypothetical protein B296_00024762 [Ensete ventricosum]|uniref:Uncharacterized protein n=1 Tax=Ensete ventricosum TaxID=4639 RepID=A0A426ZUL9_ENSVE|nr:hypothetical protein B296_00024762 [Ensete ventricosum]
MLLYDSEVEDSKKEAESNGEALQRPLRSLLSFCPIGFRPGLPFVPEEGIFGGEKGRYPLHQVPGMREGRPPDLPPSHGQGGSGLSEKGGDLEPSVSEFQIIEIAENICNLKKEQADWMLQIDIVEKGDRLQVSKQLVDLIPLIYVLCSNLYLRSDWLTPDIVLTYSSLLNKGSKGCATRNVRPLNVLAKRSYFNVMGYADTDVAEFVFKTRPSADSLVKFLCHDLSEACSSETPPVPKDRLPGDPFLAKPSKEAEMEKMLRSMEGKVIKDKDSSKKDLKQRILQSITKAGKQMKANLHKTSQRIKKWFRGKKTTSKSAKRGKSEL